MLAYLTIERTTFRMSFCLSSPALSKDYHKNIISRNGWLYVSMLNAWQRKVLTWASPDGARSDEELIRKGVLTAALVPSLRLLDWVLVGIAVSLYSLLKYYALTDIKIWIILWILNLIISGSVVIFNDRYKIDITLMQALRRLVTAMINKSRPAGFALETFIFFRLLLWDGGDRRFGQK